MDPIDEELDENPETRFPAVPLPDPDFCPPCHCPRTIAGPRFSSPRTALSPEETERLDRCIEAANELLLTLGLPRGQNGHTPNGRALQQHFRKMRGTLVRVQVANDSDHRKVLGLIHDAGRNYLQLDTVDHLTLIPFERLLTLTRSTHSAPPDHHEPELLNIDACFRRALVRDFGNVVACSPELINLFFGITLSQKLTSLVGTEVLVHTEQQKPRKGLSGTVVSADDNSLQLQVRKVIVNVSLPTVCLVRVL